jgi:hypothetical protein
MHPNVATATGFKGRCHVVADYLWKGLQIGEGNNSATNWQGTYLL